MSARLPKANSWLVHYINSDLVTVGQNIVNGLTASVADFPSPPVSVVNLQAAVNNYSTALTLSIGGSKEQRKAMAAARAVLRNNLRQDCNYVNQIIYGLILAGTSYTDAQTLIAGTGYQLSVDPSPAGPLSAPVVKKFGSNQIGQFNIQLIKVPTAKGYEVLLTDVTASTQTTLTFANTRIVISGLISGHTYSSSQAAIGASTVRNFNAPITQVVT